jgi:hypothetical protein
VTHCISYQPSSFCWQPMNTTSRGCARNSTEEGWMRSFSGRSVVAHVCACARARVCVCVWGGGGGRQRQSTSAMCCVGRRRR